MCDQFVVPEELLYIVDVLEMVVPLLEKMRMSPK